MRFIQNLGTDPLILGYTYAIFQPYGSLVVDPVVGHFPVSHCSLELLKFWASSLCLPDSIFQIVLDCHCVQVTLLYYFQLQSLEFIAQSWLFLTNQQIAAIVLPTQGVRYDVSLAGVILNVQVVVLDQL
jgi:hypothetical protein